MLLWNISQLDQVELGLRIRRARESANLSQEELAHAVNRDQKAVSEYENGKRKLAATEIPTFALVLGVPIQYFFEDNAPIDDLDQVLLLEFHTLATHDDKRAAIQAVRLISETVKRHSS